jgi:hypothetical protein
MSSTRESLFLVALLAPAVGPVVADEKIGAAVKKLRLDARALNEAQALAVLECCRSPFLVIPRSLHLG